jgi:hypothetical protein
MAHTSEKRWLSDVRRGEGVSPDASRYLTNLITTLNAAEEGYQQMQEIYIYAGGTPTLLAELLFKEDIEARSSPDNVASAEEIAKAQDLVDAMAAAHEIWQAANNVAVAQEDRMNALRRMV